VRGPIRLLLALLLLLATAGPAAAAPPGQVDVAFLQGEQVVTVARPGTTADAAVRALIAGPTAAEKREKITSTVPRRTALRGVSVAGGVATIDLDRRFASGRKAEVLAARVAQLVLTATAVSGVESVQLLIDGGTPLGLFPGYATKFPITAADVRDEDVPAPEEPPAPAEKDPNASVRALHDRLADLGFLPRSGVDGRSGEQTRFAVVAFQKWARLDRDGIAGPRTRAALGWRGRPGLGSRAIAAGARGWDVAALQWLLATRGFPSGSFDGRLGVRGDAALRRFQAWAGLGADGVAGPATLAAVRRPPARSPLQFLAPLGGAPTDRFGPRGDSMHTGIDYPAAAGTGVAAAGRGCVRSAGFDRGGYGNVVVIEHRAGMTSWYAHLDTIAVSRGQCLVAGNPVGTVGSTGNSTGPHLHFELRLRGAAVDPLTGL
jgi:murein DD-endopeptidase MepM/ murein hydrolase activator NlpD